MNHIVASASKSQYEHVVVPGFLDVVPVSERMIPEQPMRDFVICQQWGDGHGQD